MTEDKSCSICRKAPDGHDEIECIKNRTLVIDDERTMRFPATYARTTSEGIEQIATNGPWMEVWLDNDMGFGAGGDVINLVVMIEEEAHNGKKVDVNVFVAHSSNPVAKKIIYDILNRIGYACFMVDGNNYVEK